MPALVSTLLGFFSSAGPIAGFFVWIGKKVTIKAIILPIQYAVVGALVTAKVAFLIASMTLVLWFYNQLNLIFQYIENLTNVNAQWEIIIQVLRAIGLIGAFMDVFSTLSFLIVSILLLMVSKLVLHSLKLASDEFFKIGMLLSN